MIYENDHNDKSYHVNITNIQGVTIVGDGSGATATATISYDLK